MDYQRRADIEESQDALKIDSAELLQGDSLEILPKLPKASFDACITDPPYNISGNEGRRNIGWLKSNSIWTKDKKFQRIDEKWDRFTHSEYTLFTMDWLTKVCEVVKPNGNIIVFGSFHNIYTIGHVAKEMNLYVGNSIVWYKRNAFPNITQRSLCESTEHMIWIVNNPASEAKGWTFNYSHAKELNSQRGCEGCGSTWDIRFEYCPKCGSKLTTIAQKQMRNVWDMPMTSNYERKHGKHPAQKSLSVINRLVLCFTNPGDKVLDPFMGIGTVPLSCALQERSSLGIELDHTYFDTAVKRIKDKEYYVR